TILKQAGNHGRAFCAAVAVELIPSQLIPVALNEQRAALGTVRALSGDVVDVADVGELDAGRERLFAGTVERFGRRSRLVLHAEVGMKRGEMHGDVRPEFADDP